MSKVDFAMLSIELHNNDNNNNNNAAFIKGGSYNKENSSAFMVCLIPL